MKFVIIESVTFMSAGFVFTNVIVIRKVEIKLFNLLCYIFTEFKLLKNILIKKYGIISK